jgi:hypothetical protein
MTKTTIALLLICAPMLNGCENCSKPVEVSKEATLEDLTVPIEALPDDCKLAPSVGLPFSPGGNANPMTTRDPEDIGMLCMFALMPGLSTDPGAKEESREDAKKRIDEWVAGQAASIDAAYLAAYYGKSGKENMVWALQFQDPEVAKGHYERLRTTSMMTHFLKGSILVVLWTDDDDRSCFNAIRAYLKKGAIR